MSLAGNIDLQHLGTFTAIAPPFSSFGSKLDLMSGMRDLWKVVRRLQ